MFIKSAPMGGLREKTFKLMSDWLIDLSLLLDKHPYQDREF